MKKLSMKHKLILVMTLVVLVMLIVVSVVYYTKITPIKRSVNTCEWNTPTDIGDCCNTNSDCGLAKLYMDSYIIRSNCPFQASCIQGKCAVICSDGYPTEEAMIKEIPQCTRDSQCDCKFYYGKDAIDCRCIDGLCAVIVAE